MNSTHGTPRTGAMAPARASHLRLVTPLTPTMHPDDLFWSEIAQLVARHTAHRDRLSVAARMTHDALQRMGRRGDDAGAQS